MQVSDLLERSGFRLQRSMSHQSRIPACTRSSSLAAATLEKVEAAFKVKRGLGGGEGGERLLRQPLRWREVGGQQPTGQYSRPPHSLPAFLGP